MTSATSFAPPTKNFRCGTFAEFRPSWAVTYTSCLKSCCCGSASNLSTDVKADLPVAATAVVVEYPDLPNLKSFNTPVLVWPLSLSAANSLVSAGPGMTRHENSVLKRLRLAPLCDIKSSAMPRTPKKFSLSVTQQTSTFAPLSPSCKCSL